MTFSLCTANGAPSCLPDSGFVPDFTVDLVPGKYQLAWKVVNGNLQGRVTINSAAWCVQLESLEESWPACCLRSSARVCFGCRKLAALVEIRAVNGAHVKASASEPLALVRVLVYWYLFWGGGHMHLCAGLRLASMLWRAWLEPISSSQSL